MPTTEQEKDSTVKEIPEVEYQKTERRQRAEAYAEEEQKKAKERLKQPIRNVGKQEYTGTKKSRAPEVQFVGRFVGKKEVRQSFPQQVLQKVKYVHIRKTPAPTVQDVGPQSQGNNDNLPQHFGAVPDWNRTSHLRMFENAQPTKYFGSGQSGALPRFFDKTVSTNKVNKPIGVNKKFRLRKGVFG